MSFRVSIDTGSTFTDLVAMHESTGEFRQAKTLSNPEDPALAVVEAIRKAGISADEITTLLYGSTVAINALLERKGPRIGFLTNEGFGDLIFIQRGNRPGPYELQWQKPRPLVSRRDCKEVAGRIDYRGREVQPLSSQGLQGAIDYFEDEGISNIAVCFLFSFADPSHELEAREEIHTRLPGAVVSLSHEVYPRWREYDRASTTIADAYVKPLVTRQINSLRRHLGDEQDRSNLLIMKSNGGVMSADAAPRAAISTVRSGPVGGVLGANFLGGLIDRENILTMDVGGTSCDVSIISNGSLVHTEEYLLTWNIPIKSPMLDVRSAAVGGGSIAWIDNGGLLRVGPHSEKGLPGPVCFDRGGIEPTVTDANLVLGYLGDDQLLGGDIPIHLDPAHTALGDLGEELAMGPSETASAIHDIATHLMVNALHEVSVGRGVDPADYTLLAFGGAGPLHAANVGWNLGVSEVIIPPLPGVTSAFGISTADLRIDYQKTVHLRSDQPRLQKLNEVFTKTLGQAETDLREESSGGQLALSAALEMRYYGQNYGTQIPVPIRELEEADLREAFERFHRAHEEFHGYRFPDEPIEVIGLMCTALGTIPAPTPPRAASTQGAPEPRRQRAAVFDEVGRVDCPVYDRGRLPAGFSASGPLVIEENVATILVPLGTAARVDKYGSVRLQQE